MFEKLVRARNSRKGFTIIELVIVIAVIGILTTVLLPNFSTTLQRADSTAKAANLSSVNKIAASTLKVTGNGEMLDVYSAVVQNFGKESAAAAASTAVFNSSTKTFTTLSKVMKDEAAPKDRENYFPVYGETSAEVAECLKGYDFVTYATKAEASTMATGLTKLAGLEGSNYVDGVFVIDASIALNCNVSMANTMFIFTDGASLEGNGYSFDCYACYFIDTGDGSQPVTFKCYGGTVSTHNTYGAFNVSNFYKDGAINWGEAPVSNKLNQITLYQGGFLTPMADVDKTASMYFCVGKASAYVDGTIAIPENCKLTLDGESHFVVEDGGTILPAQTQADSSNLGNVSVVLTAADGSQVTIDLMDGSFVGMTLAGAAATVNGTTQSAGDQTFTITPLTAQVATNRITQCAQAMLAAGGNMDVVLSVVEKVGNAMVGTAQAICVSMGDNAITAKTLSTDGLQTVNNLVNAVKTTVVDAAVSASSAVNTAISSAIGTVTINKVVNGQVKTGGAVINNISTYTSCDTGWYTKNKDSDSFTIKTAAELYGLSTLVFNGTDDFHGKTITLAPEGGVIDLSEYTPWLPIGNGQYGFRGTLDGAGCTITGMKLNVNETWIMQMLQGKGWNNTSYRVGCEDTIYGFQNGDKYGVGFIGVLENGGTLKNVTFKNSSVVFKYNWNSYGAIAVGAIRATGEDYGTTQDTTREYFDDGYRWENNDHKNRLDGKIAPVSSKDYRDRAVTNWTTTIENVTVDSSCSVTATGRCGGVCAVVAGAYYSSSGYNEAHGKLGGADDALSIFAGWGTVAIKNCSNGANVTHIPTKGAYEEGGGILGYTQVNAHTTITISNCSNSGTITAGAAAGILGSTNTGTEEKAFYTITGCTNTGTIKTVTTNGAGAAIHTASVASQIYNTSTSRAGTKFDNQKVE